MPTDPSLPDPSRSRADRRGSRSGSASERRYPAPRRGVVPPRNWASRRS